MSEFINLKNNENQSNSLKNLKLSPEEFIKLARKNKIEELSLNDIYISSIKRRYYLIKEEGKEFSLVEISPIIKKYLNEINELKSIRKFIDHLPIGIYHTDINGKIFEVNKYFYKMMELKNNSPDNLNACIFYPDKKDRENIIKKIKSGKLEVLEYQLINKSGKKLWVRDYVIKYRNQFYGVLVDITQEKEYKKKLEKKDMILSTISKGIKKLLTLPYEEDVFSEVIKSLEKVIDTDRISILEFSTKNNEVIRRAVHTKRDLTIEEMFPLQNYKFEKCVSKLREKDYLINPEEIYTKNIKKPKTSLILPLKDGDNLWGIFLFENFLEEKNWSEEEIEALKISSDLFKIAILQRKILDKLITQSISDDLTGLHNRRGFFNKANHFLNNFNKKTAFLFFIDFDNLKKINDTFGHMEGDKALKEVSKILRSIFRKKDLIARIGGDEFVVLTDVEKKEDAENLKKRINERIKKINKTLKYPYKLSVSIGVAKYDPDKIKTIDELLIVSDRNMYMEKKNKQKEGERK